MVTADNRISTRRRQPARLLEGFPIVERVRANRQTAGRRVASNHRFRSVAKQSRAQESLEGSAISGGGQRDVAGGPLSPLKYPHGADRSISARINLIDLGGSQMLTIPGEALPHRPCLRRKACRATQNSCWRSLTTRSATSSQSGASMSFERSLVLTCLARRIDGRHPD